LILILFIYLCYLSQFEANSTLAQLVFT